MTEFMGGPLDGEQSTVKRKFVGGPWDGEVREIEHWVGVIEPAVMTAGELVSQGQYVIRFDLETEEPAMVWRGAEAA